MRLSILAPALAALALAGAPTTASAQITAQTPAPAAVKFDPTRYLTIEQLRAKYRDPAGKIATIRGQEIYYKDEGTGPVLLMVHGSNGSLRTYDLIVKRLKSRYRIVRFDVGGMGLSGRISDDVAANVTPVQIAKGLLDKLGITRVTYVGVSSGGTLGMFLAAAYPDLVNRLILSNTPADRVTYGHMTQPQSFIDAQAEARREGGYQSQHFHDEFLDYFAGKPARYTPKLRTEYYDFNRRTPEKHPISLVAQIGDGKLANEAMKKVRVPTLLIWGASDKLLPIAAMNSLEQHLQNAEVSKVIMPDVGHYPPVETPVRFSKILEAYIEGAVID